MRGGIEGREEHAGNLEAIRTARRSDIRIPKGSQRTDSPHNAPHERRAGVSAHPRH